MTAATNPRPSAIERTLGLLEQPPARPPRQRDGYLDLIGAQRAGAQSLGQRAMTSRALPIIYERLWRPIGVWLAFGAIGVGGAIEHDETFEMLELDRDDVVLDVACGPGNVTRRLLGWIGKPGLVVGLDASPSMLERAVRDTDAPNAAYVRADAHRLPFRDASFDAVCCYAALYLAQFVGARKPTERLPFLADDRRSVPADRLADPGWAAPGALCAERTDAAGADRDRDRPHLASAAVGRHDRSRARGRQGTGL
jgi:SAM-dependent methyltransferase